MPLDQIVDVALSRDPTKGFPPIFTVLNFQDSLSFVVAPPAFLVQLLTARPHFSHKRGLPPLTLDIPSICTHSSRSGAKRGDLPSFADAYLDNTNDDQYKLNALWPENISDSLPPELQRLQLTSPVRTQHVLQNNQIDPALLTGEDTNSRREYYWGELSSPMSPYSPLGSGVSPSLGFPSPLTPMYASVETEETNRGREYYWGEPSPPASPYSPLGSGVSSSFGFPSPLTPVYASVETDPATARLHFLSMSAYPVLTYATSRESTPDSALHSPVTVSSHSSRPLNM
ncbi:uncharacterized protein EDB91DRAFT_1078445 [Suillus paluster]|uniref:uncharacterized protein n=1 Tax=Suillus paluster TaxID=48578 RepID=UPI001B875121|nr:uncharacterized protein EDB91DRAFT_1078445 [Suillus paluster]KAG1750402.1 hypothetical protein EDB91DRAFT_1078445 [Suillus paluster]